MGNMQMLNTVGRRVLILLLAVCSLVLFLAGCRNVLEPGDALGNDANTGTLVLTIVRQGAARTIVPDLSMNDFVRFRLNFEVADECDSGNDDFYRIWENDITYGTILLDPGIWDLTVTAYMDDGESEYPVATAAGRLRVDVIPGATISGNVALAPYTEGQGMFSWNIGFDTVNLAFARMSVTRIDGVDLTPFGNPFLHGGQPLRGRIDSEGFSAGQYRVVVVLQRNNGDMAELRTILHVYRGKTSHLAVTFTDEHFGVYVLDHILGAWPNPGVNFSQRSITAGTLSVAGISGVDIGNFADVVRWFNNLSSSSDLHPTDLAGLRRLTDAALVGVAIEGFGSFENRAQVREAILERISNDTATPTISWRDDNMATVRVGGYDILFDIPVLPTTPPHVGMLTLSARLEWLRDNAQSHNYYLIEVAETNDVFPADTLLPSGRTNITVILRGTGGRQTVTLRHQSGIMFNVGSGVTLVLDENVTLVGRTQGLTGIAADNNNHLIRVNSGGTLIMNAGARITDNTNNTGTAADGGGGVRVNNGGVFIMNGGEISGNRTTSTADVIIGGIWINVGNGGGVRVESGGRFDMLGGTISSNTGQNGGGVWNQGTFRMSGGVIYGNETTVGAFGNTVRGTGASLSNAGTANRGTFNADGTFSAMASLTTTGNTIRVLNGNLQ